MSFIDIILPQTVIADIYKNHLVEIPGKKTKSPANISPENLDSALNSLRYLGNNLKKILVLVNYPEEVFLPDGHLEFLGKILSACKLDIGDIAIVNMAKNELTANDYLRILNPKSILVFGTNGSSLGFEEMDVFIPGFHQGISIMTAPALEKLSPETTENKQLKSKLWLSLRQFFNI